MTAALRVVRENETPDTENQWDALVERGRVAAQSQWVLGDLALEVETTYGGGQLQEYADAIGVEYDQLRKYRMVSATYENGVRTPNVPWSVHMILASQPDRHELIKSSPRDHGIDADTWTVRAARELVRRRKGVREDKGEVKTEVRENRSEVKGISNIGYDGKDYSRPPEPDPELRFHNARIKLRDTFSDVYREFVKASNESREVRRDCVDYLRFKAEQFLKAADRLEEKLKNGGNESV